MIRCEIYSCVITNVIHKNIVLINRSLNVGANTAKLKDSEHIEHTNTKLKQNNLHE